MKTEDILRSLGWALPELVLVGAILAVILLDIARLRKLVPVFAMAGIAVAGAFLWSYTRRVDAGAPAAVFEGAFAVDTYAFFFKLAFLGAAFLVALISVPSIRSWPSGQGEYFALLLSCTFGMLLMAGANDLLMMYLALEFVSITSYVMAGMLRKNRKSAEASLKYIIYGAGASGFMIYGMSFLYGVAGSLGVEAVGQALEAQRVQPTFTLITSVLIMAGFGYKIAAAPFHMWCPDVYEGAPTPVTAFFSVGPKAAGFAMLVRFVEGVFPEGGQFEWQLVLGLLALLTMAVGNFGALHQQNLKRLLAYSSIAHAGYLLVAFAAFTPEARSGLLFYLVVYVIMNLGAFLLVMVLEEKYGIETVDGCRGLGWRAPQLGIVATIFLVSLTGLPPMAGFAGKVLVFAPVVAKGGELALLLVVVAVVFSVVSLYYYMRIVAAMYLAKSREADEEAAARPAGAVYSSVLWLLAAATVLLGVWWSPLEALTSKALLR
jgi:NADH-quinone oxidoreductase subunit N